MYIFYKSFLDREKRLKKRLKHLYYKRGLPKLKVSMCEVILGVEEEKGLEDIRNEGGLGGGHLIKIPQIMHILVLSSLHSALFSGTALLILPFKP